MITSQARIRERIRISCQHVKEHRHVMYWLRLLVANYIDGDGRISDGNNKEDRFDEVELAHWEEGRYNPISNNTQVTVERLMANEPALTWTSIPTASGRGELIAATRKAYYSMQWEKRNLSEHYAKKLLDLITLGEANFGCFVRGKSIYPEYMDSLNVYWDPSQKDPCQREYVSYDISITMGKAFEFYPEGMKRLEPFARPEQMDKQIWIRCFYDRDNGTEAVIYRNEFIYGPTANRYGHDVMPIRCDVLTQMPSVKHASGIVERQVGSHELKVRIRRYFRDTALKALAVGVASGNFNEDQLKKLETGEDLILRGSPGSQFSWAKGAEIAATTIQVDQMTTQDIQAESGINEFQLNQSGSQVDFASQLGYLAQQGSSRDRFLSMKVEVGVKNDLLELIMPIAAKFDQDDFSLDILGQPVAFGHFGYDSYGNPRVPINSLLGNDGKVSMRPGGLVFKAPAQALQEDMILTQLLTLTQSAPPGMQEHLCRRILKNADVEDPERWIMAWKQAQMELAAKEEKMMQMQMMAGAQPGQRQSGQQSSQPSLPKPQSAAAM